MRWADSGTGPPHSQIYNGYSYIQPEVLMTTRMAAEQQQFHNLANISAAHTKEHIRKLAEGNKDISEELYHAKVRAIFQPAPVPGPEQTLLAILDFDSGEQLSFESMLLEMSVPFSGESRGYATFFTPPSDLVQIENVQVFVPALAPVTNINWLLRWYPIGSFSGTIVSAPSVPSTPLFGSGIFRKM